MQKNEIKQYLSGLGKKGGETTLKKYGLNFFSRIGRLGGKTKREKVLASFTVGELENPVTKKSITEKLEQIDNE